MISETQQEQATLYALELLDAGEAALFEQEIGADAELREFVRDLQETAALLAVAGADEVVEAPPALRDRVLAEVKAREQPVPDWAKSSRATKPAGLWADWFPWSVAAVFSGCAGVLLWLYVQQWGQNVDLRRDVRGYQQSLTALRADIGQATAAPIAQVSFCALEPTPEFTTAQPRAAVIWDAVHHEGKLRVNRLAPPAEGKDYQLWTVEKDRKDAVSAGVVHVDADGKADILFLPVEADGKPVVAVAISLEKAGGSPTNQGPILLLGKF